VLGTNLLHSYILAVQPIIFFVLVCFTTTPNSHVLVAQLLSAVFSTIMTIVIIGTIINIITDSLSNPTSIFLFILVSLFLVAGLLHPQEFACLLPGILYFLTFPSAYLLLPLYSLCNLNVVSWGTREKPQAKTKEELEREKLEELERKKRKQEKNGLLKWLGLATVLEDLKEFYNSVLGRKTAEDNSDIDSLTKRLDDLEKNGEAKDSCAAKNRNELREMLNRKRSSQPKPTAGGQRTKGENKSKDAKKLDEPKRDDLVNPYWLEIDGVGEGEIEEISEKESSFWRLLIRIHLHPIVKNKEKERNMELALKSLRTNIVFGFMMLNFLWVIILFQLQLLSEVLRDAFFIPIPKIGSPGEKLLIEPLGFAFLVTFGVVIILQFIGMVIHRTDTFFHIISRTEIRASEDTATGKLRTAEKMQSLQTDVDDELGIPPPDYEEEPEADYGDDDDDNEAQNDMERRSSSDSAFGRADSISSEDRPRYERSRFVPSPRRDPNRPLPLITDDKPNSRSRYQPLAPDGSERNYRRGPRDDFFDPSQPQPPHRRITRRYTRQRQPVGQMRVGGLSLHRNFQRRFKHLVSQIDGGNPEEVRPRIRPTNFDDIYRTVRYKFGGVEGRSDRRRHAQSEAYPQQFYNRRV